MSKVEIISKTHFDSLGNLFFDVSVRDGDTVTEKRLGAEEYLALFKNSFRDKETFTRIPRLPESVLAAYVSSRNEETFQAVVLFKAQKRPFLFVGQHYLLPFPALIARIVVKDGVRREMQLYALATDEPTEDTPLMNYPFGNVNSTGGCCFGNIVVKDLKDATMAPKVLETFLCGETNNDYWDCWKAKGMKYQGDLVEFLSREETFPANLLVSAGRLTVGELCKEK